MRGNGLRWYSSFPGFSRPKPEGKPDGLRPTVPSRKLRGWFRVRAISGLAPDRDAGRAVAMNARLAAPVDKRRSTEPGGLAPPHAWRVRIFLAVGSATGRGSLAGLARGRR